MALTTYINIVVVFVISGLWHGANWTFILWGLLHGLFNVIDRMIDKFIEKIHPALKWMCNFLLICILWLLFRSDNVKEWITVMKQMTSMQDLSISAELLNQFVTPQTNFLIDILHLEYISDSVRGFTMIVFYIMALVICLGFENANIMNKKKTTFSAFVYGLLFLFCLTSFGTETVFVYFNF